MVVCGGLVLVDGAFHLDYASIRRYFVSYSSSFHEWLAVTMIRLESPTVSNQISPFYSYHVSVRMLPLRIAFSRLVLFR